MADRKAPKKISDSDRELFRQAVAGVKPLPPSNTAPSPQVKKRPQPRPAQAEKIHTLEVDDVTPLRSDDVMQFARSGIAPRTLLQLRRGRVVPTASLDLHGLKSAPAQRALHEFIHACVARGHRCVRIIHGKGRGAHDAVSVLKSIVNRWLQDQQQVLAFCSTPPHDGGVGAVYVLLKGRA